MSGNKQLFNVEITVSQRERKKIQGSARGHVLETDQAQAFEGDDSAPTPIETFAFSLGACFVSSARLIAEIEGLDISGITATVSGVLDLAGATGLNENTRPGFPEFSIKADFKAPWTREQKQDFLDRVLKRCPVADNLCHETDIKVALAG